MSGVVANKDSVDLQATDLLPAQIFPKQSVESIASDQPNQALCDIATNSARTQSQQLPRINPCHFSELATPALVDHLRQIKVSKAQYGPMALYQRVANQLFKVPLPLKAKGLQVDVSLPLAHLVQSFNQQFRIKGSGVARLLAIDSQGKRHVNDFDFAIRVKKLDQEEVFSKLARCIREHNRSLQLKTLSDEELVRKAFQNIKQGDTWIKLRTVVPKGEVPVDLLFYTALLAQFDTLQASAYINVDMQRKHASHVEQLDKQTLAWLESNQYLWLNETMENGLGRLSVLTNKYRNPQLLQPQTVLSQLIAKATLDQQSQFFVQWLVDEKSPSAASHALILALQAGDATNLELDHAVQGVVDWVDARHDRDNPAWALMMRSMLRMAPDPKQRLCESLKFRPALLEQLAVDVVRTFPALTTNSAAIIAHMNSQIALEHPQVQTLLLASKACVFDEQNLLATLYKSNLLAQESADLCEQSRCLLAIYACCSQRLEFATGGLDDRIKQLLVEQLRQANTSIETWPPQLLLNIEHGLVLLDRDKTKKMKLLRASIATRTHQDIETLFKSTPRIAQLLLSRQLGDCDAQVKQVLAAATTDTSELARLHFALQELATHGLVLQSMADASLNSDVNNSVDQNLDEDCSKRVSVVKPMPNSDLLCILEANELYFGKTKRCKSNGLQRNGFGACYDLRQQLLQVGAFKHNTVIDQQLRICTDRYHGWVSIENELADGQAQLNLRRLSKEIVTLYNRGKRLADSRPTKLKLNDPIGPSEFQLRGPLQGELAQVLQNPLTLMGRDGALIVEYMQTARQSVIDGTNSDQLTIARSRLSNFFLKVEDAFLEFLPAEFSVDEFKESVSVQDPVFIALRTQTDQQIQTLYLEEADLLSMAPPELVGHSGSRGAVMRIESQAGYERTLSGFYNAQQQAFLGETRVYFANGSTFAGPVADTLPHGVGRLRHKDEAYGRVCNMYKGDPYDVRLAHIASSIAPTEAKQALRPLFAFEFPDLDPHNTQHCRFSLLNEQGDQFIGFKHAHTVSGKLFSVNCEQLEGDLLVVPEPIQKFWQQQIHSAAHANWHLVLPEQKPLTDSGAVFRDPQGQRYGFVPVSTTIISGAGQRRRAIEYAFGARLTEVVRNPISTRDETVLRSTRDPKVSITMTGEMLTNIRTERNVYESAKSLAQSISARDQLMGEGTVTTLDRHYVGSLFGHQPHGQGCLTFLNAAPLQQKTSSAPTSQSKQIGLFEQGRLAEGVLSLSSGLSFSGRWQQGKLLEPVEVRWPSDERVSTVVPAQLCRALAARGFMLSPGELVKLFGSAEYF